jgi:hypothetical protein
MKTAFIGIFWVLCVQMSFGAHRICMFSAPSANFSSALQSSMATLTPNDEVSNFTQTNQQDSLVPPPADTLRPLPPFEPETKVYNPRSGHHSVFLNFLSANTNQGAEIGYRFHRNQRGVEVAVQGYLVPIDRKQYFYGTYNNRTLEVKTDTVATSPAIRNLGEYRYAQGTPLPLAPPIVSTSLYSLSVGIPFVFKTQNKLVQVFLTPKIGLMQHQFLRIIDTTRVISSVLVTTNLPHPTIIGLRTEEYIRSLEQTRTMTPDTDYLPFLAYSMNAQYQLTHHLSLDIGATGAFQTRDYNIVQNVTALKQVHLRLQAGVVFRLNPGPRPVKPKERVIMRL